MIIIYIFNAFFFFLCISHFQVLCSGQALPTSLPTSHPTKHPTKAPTLTPTLTPTITPTLAPTLAPTMTPTLSPTMTQPTSHPTKHPTMTPTMTPTMAPTMVPTLAPTAQPTSHPTKHPTIAPTMAPTMTPTMVPSAQPTSHPTNHPTSFPTSLPTDMPTLKPISKPTSLPTNQPSSNPSGQPISWPSSFPTITPTSNPTNQPFSLPTSLPSGQPTTQPSSQPSSRPTSQPSSIPSSMPTAQPSNYPTSKPSSQPSGLPSSQPTSQPTSIPSTQPTSQPTSNPTFSPTSRDGIRYFTCGSQFHCESRSTSNCTFSSGNIWILCQDASPCVINSEIFSVGPNSNVYVNGTCELVVNSKTISILQHSMIDASSILFQAYNNVYLWGSLKTDGRGSFRGPGTPSSETYDVMGASYGGSGGLSECHKEKSSTQIQIGSVDVLSDVNIYPRGDNPTYGSGSGDPLGGRGGGRIQIYSNQTIFLYPNSNVSAQGSSPQNFKSGAGSGGSIILVSNYLNLKGLLSVRGGPGFQAGAGGGGRIGIYLNSQKVFSNESYQFIDLEGGIYYSNKSSESVTSGCGVGAPGTLYLSYQNNTNASIIIYNQINIPEASTILLNATKQTYQILVSNNVQLYAGDIILPISQKYQTTSKCYSCSQFIVQRSNYYCFVAANNENYISKISPKIANSGLNDTKGCLLLSDQIHFISSNFTSLVKDPSIVIHTHVFNLTKDSNVYYGSLFYVNSSTVLNTQGNVEHTESISNSSILVLYSNGSVTLNTVRSNNIFVYGNSILMSTNTNLQGGYSQSAQCTTMKINSKCEYNFTSMANVHYFSATRKIDLQSNGKIVASNIIMCSPSIVLSKNSVIKTDGLGCVANSGPGAGSSSLTQGGGGAGNGGKGGNGYDSNNNGGIAISTSINTLISGSGGGCNTCINTGSNGGGIVNIISNNFTSYANISSIGESGLVNDGGGSGGSISLYVSKMYGLGNIIASGGNGGSGNLPGGGGAGGFIQIQNINLNSDISSESYTGSFLTYGGAAGAFSSSSEEVTSIGTLFSRFLSTSSAQNGGNGIIEMPNCKPGYGNDPSSGKICELCPAGTFNPGNNDNSCLKCKNAPSHSYYTEEGWATSNCPYECEPGYSTSDCYDQFSKFIFSTLTIPGLIGVIIAVSGMIFIPIIYYRYRKIYRREWQEETSAVDFFKRTVLVDLGLVADDMNQKNSSKKSRDISKDKSIDVNNPIYSIKSKGIQNEDDNEDEEDREVGHRVAKIRSLHAKYGKEMRRENRMHDSDMSFHACRINFKGCNHPFEIKGGPWILPLERPNCLKPMLLKKEYREFAIKVNEIVSYECTNNSELFFFLFIFIFFPPLAALVLLEYRKKRAMRLLKFIAQYDYACFRCPEQRKSQNSLRIGISPDATLAYLDFLYDEERHSKFAKPLCPIGQTKLPASFRFAGLGTYNSPFYIDTNDMVLQAVPQTDVTSAFIDDAWINFIYELNKILRTVQRDALYSGIISLIKFLSIPKHTSSLGGLHVEFCTFDNTNVLNSQIYTLKSSDANNIVDPKSTIRSNLTTGPQNPSVESEDLRYSRHSLHENWLNALIFSSSKPKESFSNGPGTFELKTSNSNSTLNVPNNSKLSFSEPIHNSSKKQPQKQEQSKISGLYNFFLRGLYLLFYPFQYAIDSIKFLFGYIDLSYPYTMSSKIDIPFFEMCRAIALGKMTMGIVVSHPKVFNNIYLINDFDYSSDDEEFESLYADEYPLDDENITTRDSKISLSNSNRPSLADNMMLSSNLNVNDQSLLKTSNSGLESDQHISNLQKTYGNKAEEMAKFYRIMLASGQQIINPSIQLESSSNPLNQNQILSDDIKAIESPLKPNDKKRSKSAINKEVQQTSSYTDMSKLAELTNNSEAVIEFESLNIARNSSGQDLEEFKIRRSTGNEDNEDFPESENDDDFDNKSYNSADSRETKHKTFENSPPSPSRRMNIGSPIISPINEMNAIYSEENSSFSDNNPMNPDSAVSISNTNSINPIPIGSFSTSKQSSFSQRKIPMDINHFNKLLLLRSNPNLAPSCYQHDIAIWRMPDPNKDPFCYFTLQYNCEIGGETSDLVRGIKAIGNNFIKTLNKLNPMSLHEENSQQGSEQNSFDQTMDDIDDEFEHQQKEKLSHHRSSELLNKNGRDSFFPTPHLFRFSIFNHTPPPTASTSNNIEDSTSFSNTTSTSSRPISTGLMRAISSVSSISMNNHKETTESNQEEDKGIFKNVRAIFRTSLTPDIFPISPISKNVFLNNPLFRGLDYIYKNHFFLYYFRRFMFGMNVYPWGPNYFKAIFEFVTFFLCLSDIILWVFIIVNTYCVSSDTTDCTNHNNLYLLVSIWPLAFALAPVLGIATILLGPSTTLSRVYALYSRLAAINNLLIIIFVLEYLSYYYHVPGSVYLIIAVSVSRYLQCFFVDLYIAHIDRMRFTRGWDGLHTSLFKTGDYKKEIQT